jgi:predicted DNA-binding transcriptional regulator YafY
MRRAERLFEIIQILRRKSVVRANDLATILEVSERTIYRDISHLVARGVPIDGEAGIGYILRPGFELPPLMFTEEEIEALLLGARIVQSWADPELGKAAGALTNKIRAVLPEPLGRQLDLFRILAPPRHAAETITIDQAALRRAIRDQQKVRFTYLSLSGRLSERFVRPLIMAYYGPIWLLATWCEDREGFRVFRLDRMSKLIVVDETFDAEAGKTAEDFLRQDRAYDVTR